MKMAKLHYAPNASGENSSEILIFESQNLQDLVDKIEYETMLKQDRNKLNNVVYLCSVDDLSCDQSHILVDRNASFICEVLQNVIINADIEDIWLFTCTSFEDAYKTALDMKEGCDYDSDLCYEPSVNPSDN